MAGESGPRELQIGFSIAHAAFLPERRATLDRLLSKLPRGPMTWVEPSPNQVPAHEWSGRQWAAAFHWQKLPTHVCFLNDDAIPCDGFADTLRRVIEARSNHVIDLYNCVPPAKVADERGLRWLTSHDGLRGVAYVLPIDAVRDLLSFREFEVRDHKRFADDQLVNLWAMARGALIWHCVPALVDHDDGIKSTMGNTPTEVTIEGRTLTAHFGRRAEVPPRADMPQDWSTDAIHVGRVHEGNHYALVRECVPPLNRRYWEVAGPP